MRASKRRHKITIQSKGFSSGDAGGLVADTPVTQYEVRAEIESTSGGETFRFAQMEISTSHRLEVHYNTGITELMEVVYGSRTFDIRAVLHDEQRRRWTRLFCEERTP